MLKLPSPPNRTILLIAGGAVSTIVLLAAIVGAWGMSPPPTATMQANKTIVETDPPAISRIVRLGGLGSLSIGFTIEYLEAQFNILYIFKKS